MLCLSQDALQSKWVAFERDVAFVKECDGEKRLIPVKLTECETPTLLLAKHHLDLTVDLEAGIDKLRRAILEPLRKVIHLAAPKGADKAAVERDVVSGVERIRQLETEKKILELEKRTLAGQNRLLQHQATELKKIATAGPEA